MDIAVKEVQGRISKWNFVTKKRFGFLEVDNHPRIVFLIHRKQMKGTTTPDKIKVGNICKFTLRRDRKGKFKGYEFIILREEMKAAHCVPEITIDVQSPVMSPNRSPVSILSSELKYSHSPASTPKSYQFTYFDSDEISLMDAKDVTHIRKSIAFLRSLPPSILSTKAQATQSLDQEETESSKSIFISTMEPFSLKKHAELIADLYSNTKKGETRMVDDNYTAAASYVLHSNTSPPFITLDVILEVHRLVGCGLIDSAGVLRRNKVKVGSKKFPSPRLVLPLLRRFLELLQTHIQSYFTKNFGSDSFDGLEDWVDCESMDNVVREGCTLAAWAGYHFVGIHPFTDGNCRTSRILMNWVLKRCLSLPFPICFCPTPLQRTVYIKAVRHCDCLMLAKHIGHRCAGILEEYFNVCKDLEGMAALPVTSSATEKTSEDEKKQQKVSMPLEASEELVNLARADLRSACCLICMVEAPTLSTLCCGQPVHFSCLCNWLTSRRHTGASIDCPHCRCDMSEPNVSPPEPPRRVGVEMSGSDSGSEDSDDSSSTIDFFDLISDGNESIEEGDSSGSGSGESYTDY